MFDAKGHLLAASDEGQSVVEAPAVGRVVSTLSPTAGPEADAEEAGDEFRFEYLLPVRTSEGVLVMEVDQRADLIGGVRTDLRQRKVLGLLLVALFTAPLSYLLGGRSLRRRQHQADRMADTDALTGVAGRRPFRPSLQATLSEPDNTTVALALIDIDRFKRVNDQLGHSYGDRVLVALGESFEALRASDSAFRLGGDEFAVVLPDADDDQAVVVLDRVRAGLEARVPGITVSCGGCVRASRRCRVAAGAVGAERIGAVRGQAPRPRPYGHHRRHRGRHRRHR